jgi:hypothetical protein
MARVICAIFLVARMRRRMSRGVSAGIAHLQ